MPPAIPRPPSYIPPRQSELGSFQEFLEKPKSTKSKRNVHRDMPVRRQSGEWSRLTWQAMEIFLAELVGTGMLMFFGCMGQVSWPLGAPLPPFQGAIVFAVVVATIIQIFGHISAAHLNPAVTIAFVMLGQVTPAMAVVYLVAECAGAVLGYGLLILLTPAELISPANSTVGLCCTVPQSLLTDVQAVSLEFFATFFLVMVVCACSDSRNAGNTDSTPLKFGCTILALSIAVGPYTGASMNPARSLAPALWTGVWTSHWAYWLGPCLSGFFTPIFYQAIFNKDQSDMLCVQNEEVPLNQVKVNALRTDVKEKEQSPLKV